MTTTFSLRTAAAAGAVALLAAVWAAPAAAVATDCDTYDVAIPRDPYLSTKVSNTLACQVGSENNPSEAKVNADQFFGFSDWKFAGKLEAENTVAGAGSDTTTNLFEDGVFDLINSITFTVSGIGATSGNWSISGITGPGLTAANFLDNYSAMITFKAGGTSTVPPDFVGYLLTDLSGTWNSMFLNGDAPVAMSNVSLYLRDLSPNNSIDPPVIPAPAGVLLLVSAFGVAAGARALRRA